MGWSGYTSLCAIEPLPTIGWPQRDRKAISNRRKAARRNRAKR